MSGKLISRREGKKGKERVAERANEVIKDTGTLVKRKERSHSP